MARSLTRGGMIGCPSLLWVVLSGCCLLGSGCSFIENWDNPFAGAGYKRTRIAAAPVQTRDVQWRGWPAIEQSNGLITLRHVPAAGGRTLSLEINQDDAFLVQPQFQGKTFPLHSRDTGIQFGGHYVNIGPEHIFNADEQPFNPNAGPYRIWDRKKRSDQHTLHLASRQGTWKGATIAMDRTITVYQGSTHVLLDETVTNYGPEPLSFNLADVTQLDAVNRREPTHSLRRISLYVPVVRKDGKKSYTPLILLEPQVDRQFDEGLAEDILAIHYAGKLFKIASHDEAPWIAAVDHDTGWTYVKAFEVNRQDHYLPGSGPIEVSGSTYDQGKQTATVEMNLITSLKKCSPKQAITQREHWYATVCRGPILELTPVGVVCEKISLAREKSYYDLSGRFGVFYLGSARLQIEDHKGEILFSSDPILIDPRKEFILSATLPVKPDAYQIVLKVFDHRHREVDELARVNV